MVTRRRTKAQDVLTKSNTSSNEEHSEKEEPTTRDMRAFLQRQPLWVGLAIASGMCAAINGVFAKLTTTSLTSSLSSNLSSLLGLSADNAVVNVGLRGSFFGLNLLFNAIMWALFTAALTKGDSTTRVSIVNVSANFFVTAILGWLIFSEKLPLQWWLGAALLACGNVIIGRRTEGEKVGGTTGLDENRTEAAETRTTFTDDVESEGANLIQLEETAHSDGKKSLEETQRVRKWENNDNPI